MKRGISIAGVLSVLVLVGYVRLALPTKIALVNFRDSQMAEVAKANENVFIKPIQINPKEDDFSSIVDFPVIYLSHISILSEAQNANLKLAMENGAKVHVLMATSKENDHSNLAGDDLKYINTCFQNSGVKNIQNWLNYSRKVFDDQSLFVDEIKSPVTFPHDVFYRIGTSDYFVDLEEYWSYYKRDSLYKEGKPVVAIVNANTSPQSGLRSYQDKLILNLESRGFNVVAVSGFSKRLENLKAVNPDLVCYIPHGRLNMRNGDAAVKWLKSKNILVMMPQLVYQSYDEWMEDQQGMAGGIFGQNIVVPELDGAIHPYAIAAEYLNEQGYHTFKAIPGRIDGFCETVQRWLSLKEKPNSEKKLTIFYYKGAGKNALVAGGLEVGPSIHKVLKRLQEEGYDLGYLPENYDEFIAQVYKDGPVLGGYAKGSFEEWLKVANPAYVSVQEYESWCKSQLPKEAYDEVTKLYGPAPGNYLTTKIQDTSYFAIPRVQFGKVSLMPVLQASQGDNEFKQAHGVKKAPPHAYIASYLWPRMKEKVDVVAHFGAHGSVEFTPYKQVLPSKRDWAEALISPIPHLYLYSIDNIGEAMMAKRRSYATMVSHLTPPQAQAELYGGLQDISRVLHDFATAQDGELKEANRNTIKLFADTLNLETDLSLSKDDIEKMSDETVQDLHNYVHHLEKEKITMGWHIYGEAYAEEERIETAKMMTVDPVAQALTQISQVRGVLPEHYQSHGHHHGNDHNSSHGHSHGKGHSKMHGNEHDDIALHMVIDVLENGHSPASLIPKEDLDLIDELIDEYGLPKEIVISEYYGGNYGKKKETKTAGNKELVYDVKSHKMVPKSTLKEKKKKEGHPHQHSHGKSHQHNSSHSQSKTHTHTNDEKKEELVYNMSTHKMVPKSEYHHLNSEHRHDQEYAHDHPEHNSHKGQSHEVEKELVHEHNHKEGHDQSHSHPGIQKTGEKVNHSHSEDLVYDMNTHKMVPKSSMNKKEISAEQAQDLALHLSAQRSTSEGMERLKKEVAFREISSLLDGAQMHKFKNTAKLDQSIKDRVELVTNENFKKLLVFAQDSSKRTYLLNWLALEETKQRISSYRKKLDAMVIGKAEKGSTGFLDIYKLSTENYRAKLKMLNREEVKSDRALLTFFEDNKDAIFEAQGLSPNLIAVKAILESTASNKLITDKLQMAEERRLEIATRDKQLLASLLQLRNSLESVNEYYINLKNSPLLELDAFINGMDGGFVAPSSGGDPISNPLATPTGKNLYAVNAEVTPTKEAYDLGKKMADQILQKHLAKHGEYPKKIAYSLWGGEFVRNQGLNIGQIMFMLGVEPVRNGRGRVHDVKLIPEDQLKRPRIDVVVQTSGQFRDLAASRVYLINKAIQLASNADDDQKFPNYVKQGTEQAEADMKEKGMSPEEARKFSTVRIFGSTNGGYGTGIMELVEQGDKWEKEEEIAAQYIKNMGAMYSEENWSDYRTGMFETMLKNTEVVVHPRSSNVTGPISLDHVYEFMGGITASVRVTTGKDPDGYFNDFRNKFDPKAQGLKEAIWAETRTNLFNPKFIKAQLAEGESAADSFAENFRDTYGWNVMKPDAIDKEIWDGYYDIYVKDKLDLGTVRFFEEKNPYALQEMTAVMLETIRKGYWQPSDVVVKDIAETHAKLIKDHEAGCSGFVCNNSKLKQMIEGLLSGELKEVYKEEIAEIRTGTGEKKKQDGVVLKKEEKKTISEIIENNQKAVISLILAILLITGAIGVGIVKRRKLE